MKSYTMYVCEKCNNQSKNRGEISLCEGKHIGLNTLEEVQEYANLLEKVRRTSGALSCSQNPDLLKKQDDAIGELIAFEKKFNIKVD